CANCATTSTPLWRRGPNAEVICNACGQSFPGLTSSANNNNNLGRPPGPHREHMQCINCRTDSTPLWRRDDKGNAICNACGLYYKLHATHRPVTMKRSVIKRRKRV
ncbi:iron transporter biosynthesis regulating transcription factor, partial [Phlyctochytrium arcticum]